MKRPIARRPLRPVRRRILIGLFAFLWLLLPAAPGSCAAAQERGYHGIALVGDPHLPGRELPAKRSAMQTINGWTDIDRVVVLGDICKETGTPAEYAAAKEFFGSLRTPVRWIAGNHDYIYTEERDPSGRRIKGLPDDRRRKLRRSWANWPIWAFFMSRSRCRLN